MGRSLLQSEPVFRRALQECSRLVEQLLGFSLLDELHASRESSRLGRTEVCLPAIIATEIAVARLWESWGLTPAAVVGHSTGEIAAAHLVGILSLEDTMRTICAYGRTIDKLRGRGTMGLVGLSWEQAAEALHGHEGRVFRAIQNSVRSTVLAGEPAELKAVLQRLTARGVFCRPVDMDVSPHCPLAEPLRGELFEALRDIRPQKAAILLESEVSGDVLSGEPFGAAHWVRNFAEPVFFSNAIDRLLASGFTTFLEVSPHPLAKHALEANLRHRGVTGRVLSSMRRNEDARGVMLDTLGSLYASGTPVAWAALYPSAAAASPSQGQPGTLSALPFLLSGKTGEALRAQAAQLHEHLQAHVSLSLSDVAYSLATTRSHFEHRAVVVAGERQASPFRSALARARPADGSCPIRQRPKARKVRLVVYRAGQSAPRNGPTALCRLPGLSRCARRDLRAVRPGARASAAPSPLRRARL